MDSRLCLGLVSMWAIHPLRNWWSVVIKCLHVTITYPLISNLLWTPFNMRMCHQIVSPFNIRNSDHYWTLVGEGMTNPPENSDWVGDTIDMKTPLIHYFPKNSATTHGNWPLSTCYCGMWYF
jgi:hypothetical protein